MTTTTTETLTFITGCYPSAFKARTAGDACDKCWSCSECPGEGTRIWMNSFALYCDECARRKAGEYRHEDWADDENDDPERGVTEGDDSVKAHTPAAHPRYGVPVFPESVRAESIMRKPRQYRRPPQREFIAEPYGIGDWLEIVVCGERVPAQVWCPGTAVAATPLGNQFVTVIPGEARRISDPFVQLNLL